MSTAAVVLAGGSGRRAGLGQNKILQEVAGRSLLAWSVAAFSGEVDRIIVVARPADRDEITAAVGGEVTAIVDGGATRPASERAGLSAVGDAEVVAIHDGARPLVGTALVRRVLAAARDGVAVVPALGRPVPVAHWDAPEGATILHDALLVDRSRLVGVQTPQAVPTEVLRAAFAAADRAGDTRATDTVESVLQHRPDVEVVAVEGDARNLKVTWPTDVDRIKVLLEDPGAQPPVPGLRHRPGTPTGGPPPADLEVDGVTPVTDSLRVVEDGRVVRAVDRANLVDVTGDLLAASGVLDPGADDLGVAVEEAVLAGATLRLRRRR